MYETRAKVGGALLDLGVRLPYVGLEHAVNDGSVSQESSTLFAHLWVVLMLEKASLEKLMRLASVRVDYR